MSKSSDNIMFWSIPSDEHIRESATLHAVKSLVPHSMLNYAHMVLILYAPSVLKFLPSSYLVIEF